MGGSNLPVKLFPQGGTESFPRRCPGRERLIRQKRYDQFCDHLVLKLKEISYNIVHLYVFSYFRGMKQWNNQKGSKGEGPVQVTGQERRM